MPISVGSRTNVPSLSSASTIIQRPWPSRAFEPQAFMMPPVMTVGSVPARSIFERAGTDPTVITGGIINAWGSNARLGQGRWMIVEADESDGTFVRLPTQIGIVTNIDPEHLDYFKTVENMHREFEMFFRNIPFYGLAVTCIDHPVARDMVERLELRRDGRRLLTYGTTRGADLVLRGLTQEPGGIVIDAEL